MFREALKVTWPIPLHECRNIIPKSTICLVYSIHVVINPNLLVMDWSMASRSIQFLIFGVSMLGTIVHVDYQLISLRISNMGQMAVAFGKFRDSLHFIYYFVASICPSVPLSRFNSLILIFLPAFISFF